MIEMDVHERGRLQTTEEWLEEYKTGKPVYPAAAKSNLPVTLPDKESNIYTYDSHRTTKRGRLVLSFINNETGEEAIIWFNVDTYGKRGCKSGKQYRTGAGGQFISPKSRRSKFKSFWLNVVGKEPYRWSNTYKELSPRLKGLNFKCETKTSYDRDGKAYTEIKDITLVDAKRAQYEHNMSTKKAQEVCTSDSIKHTTDKTYTEFKVPSLESALKPSYPKTQIPF